MHQIKTGEIMIQEAHFVANPVPTATIKYVESTETGNVFTERTFPIAALGKEDYESAIKFLKELAEKSKTITR